MATNNAFASVSCLPSAQVQENPALVYLSKFQGGSRRTAEKSLRKLAGGDPLLFPWWDLRYKDTQQARTNLIAEGLAASTVNLHLTMLRGVLKECWRLNLMSREDCENARDIDPVKGQTLLRGRALKADELKAIFECWGKEKGPTGVRDRALLAMLFGCGLRREELANLSLDDFLEGALTVRHGKGNKARIVYAPPGTITYLAAWLAVRGDAPGPLFLPIDRHGNLGDRRLSGTAIYSIYVKRSKEASLVTTSPHDSRRTWASNMIDLGVDFATIAKMGGWSSVEMVRHYDRRGELVAQEAALRLEIP